MYAYITQKAVKKPKQSFNAVYLRYSNNSITFIYQKKTIFAQSFNPISYHENCHFSS